MNHSTTSEKCRRSTLKTDQTQRTVGGATIGTGSAKAERMEQGTHQELDVHLDPVLLDQPQEE